MVEGMVDGDPSRFQRKGIGKQGSTWTMTDRKMSGLRLERGGGWRPQVRIRGEDKKWGLTKRQGLWKQQNQIGQGQQ